MNRAPEHDLASAPHAEWHGGVAEHALKTLRLSEGFKNDSPTLTPRAAKSNRPQTAKSVAFWLALWSLPLLTLMHQQLPIADDLGAYHLPLRSIYQSALQQGEDWTWCPWIFCGYHVHGEGQIGGDHPLHQLLYRALPLLLAFGLECWWAYPATFFGMWWWLRQMRFSPGASQIAGLALSLCGFMTLRIVHLNAIQVIAHLPWLLGCLTWLEHRARRSTAWRSILPPIACSALLTASQLLLGYPQYVVFTLIAEGLWLVSLMLRSPNVRRTLAVSWFAAKGIGLLLGAAQVLPTLEYLSLSERVNWSTEQMFQGSWPLLNLTQLVAPYLFKTRVVGQNTHELTIFMGNVTVCLALLGLVNRPRRSLRAVKSYALMLGVIGLLLALGDMGPLAELTPYIPVWNQFRFPCRSMLLFCVGMVLLAALGWQRVVELSRYAGQRTGDNSTHGGLHIREKFALGLWAAITILLPLFAAWAWPEHVSDWTIHLLGPIFMLATLVQLRVTVRGILSARNSLVVLLVFELLGYALTFPFWQEMDRVDSRLLPKLHVSQDRQFANFGSDSRILTDRVDALRSNISGYAGVIPRQYLDYREQCPRALAAAGISSFYTKVEHRGSKQDYRWQEVTVDCLARGTLVTQTKVAQYPHHDIEHINPHTTALVETMLELRESSPHDHLQVKLAANRPGRLAFNVETNRDALLVTTESFHPGWHARVDGVEVPVLRVNGDFLGVRIPPAAQRVECYFSDNYHAVGRWISLGSLGLLGVILCLTRIRQNAPGFFR